MDDRELLEAKYTAPSGAEFLFFWEKSQKKTALKTGTFTFPDIDGAFVQHQGGGPVSFPMLCIFNGDGHLEKADAFEKALFEKDIAELQHPVYGIIPVIPTGDIERDEDFLETLNETHIKITFTKIIVSDEPTKPIPVAIDELENNFNDFIEASAEDFVAGITIENVNEQLQLQSSLDNQVNILNEILPGIMASSPITDNESKKIITSYSNSVTQIKNEIKTMFNKSDSFIMKAINIARLALDIMKTPSRMIINIKEKINGYSSLIASTINQFKTDPFGINKVQNSFTSTRLFLTGAIACVATGAALSIAKDFSGGKSNEKTNSVTTITPRETAIAAAIQLNNLLSEIQKFEDVKIGQNSFIDNNANSYLLLIELIHDSIQIILDISFTLFMKRTIKLDSDRNFIELCAELYGDVDNYYLDKLIIENNLNIDELEIIPMGKEVSYYVEGL